MPFKTCPNGHEFGPDRNNEWKCDRCGLGEAADLTAPEAIPEAPASLHPPAPEASAVPAPEAAPASEDNAPSEGTGANPAPEAPTTANPEAPVTNDSTATQPEAPAPAEAPKVDENANQ